LRAQPSHPEAASEPARLALSTPAKLNLGLRVLGRRPDGYHRLESLFVPIDLADDIEIEVERGRLPEGARDARIDFELSVDAAESAGTAAGAVPTDGRNLAVVAAREFLQQAAAATPSCEGAGVCRVRIRLRKRIPVGAGLGGGSSDAGAVLRALSQLVSEGPSGPELFRVALEVGADVPFFLDPRPALVTGIGDEVTPVEGFPEQSILLANPGLGLSTAEVYAAYDRMADATANEEATTASAAAEPALTTPNPASKPRPASSASSSRDALARLYACGNDLEAAAVRLCPPLARLRSRLHDLGAARVGMSGSGATMYGIFASDVEARNAQEAWECAGFEPPAWVRLVRSLG
jgi:4-diphosphocytidyl-2-C-methyl-D-erythritol kinase